jgi:hypothetical protein
MSALAAEPLQGGVEQHAPDDPYERARKGPPPPLCSQYEKSVPPGGRLHVFPKTAGGKIPLPQGGPMQERCEPPSSSLELVGEDRNYCCYVQSAPGPVIDVFDDPPPEVVVQDDPPQSPAELPPTMRPPADDPGYWAGAQAGFRNCGESVQAMMQALQAIARNDWVTAANLLGATDSGAGLRALWAQFAETRVLNLDPRKPTLTYYEVGLRQAERLCLYVLLPKASKCAVKGTACAVRGAQQQCTTMFRRIAELRPIRLTIKLPPAPTPLVRGMLLIDENYLKQLAASDQLIFIVRDSSRWSMRWIGRGGYGPKPLDVKGKTLKPEELAKDDVNRYAGLASARGLDAAARAELRDAGYSIASKAEYEIIRGPAGRNGYYSDVDLHGVYEVGGRQGWTDALRRKLDCHFFDRGVQHGPHDVWPDRNNLAKAGTNYGPQVGGKNKSTLTAYLPDGRALQITTLEEMRAFYTDIGVNFKAIYPDF